ncbi:protein translocase subunit SecD [Alicyclobacillus mali]|uniref:Protein translocase subunit SecD n=1 Tax=Alicyclobacillus mali (ex Roth et al. 2021) TaxID=1123961 RepID=A0ABS0F6F5_9BACL|nr:protein translocase subunit SecD [Alicyclobacillus mali (ex Roth et al. 2021)]MBF8378848.1 protein translocase subunit SecD [Alicyclobacillus mali (ex Roth et al. 2021)]MCL6487974.1 protein translocase subunit SecD [Alicyclobacillus mali (ex Roth et al. 2021)]
MKWGRLLAFLAMVAVVLGLTVSTGPNIWKSIPLGLDLKGGVDLLYAVDTPKGQPLDSTGKAALVRAIEMRVNSLGVSSPIIQLEGRNQLGQDQIRVEVAGVKNQQEAVNVIGATAQLAIYGSAKVDPKSGKIVPVGAPLATGADLKSNAHWVVDQQTGQNAVAIEFKDASLWTSITKRYLQKPIYVFLNGQLLTNPVIEQVMYTGQSEISGGNLTTPQACMDLANELNAGALPYPLTLESETSVGPTLGATSLHRTLVAGIIAVVLIFAFMIAAYRMAGLIADIALVAYGYLTLLTFAGLHVVLTLSGLAALILGVGIAVDANIITYERIKDEVRNGRSLRSAVRIGNRNAFRTIVDSNATTFIAGLIMYIFGGEGDVRGFAVALMVGIIVSLLTAVLFARAMLLTFTAAQAIKNPWWYGAPRGVVKSREAKV